MRQFLIAFALSLGFIACAAEEDPPIDDVFVDELSDAQQIALCEDFLDGFCSTPDGATFCDDPCIDSGCPAVVGNGDVDAECADVLESEVLVCADTGFATDCGPGAGGCIADALDLACP